MSDIIALIDGAIHDHNTSSDAMRWAPDSADTVIPARIDPQVEARMATTAELFRSAAEDLGRFMRCLADALLPLLRGVAAALRPLDTARRAQLRQMHTETSRRMRARRRRR